MATRRRRRGRCRRGNERCVPWCARSAQFQGFCRDLHSECADHLVTPVADPDLRELLRDNLLFSRKIDRGNPNPDNLGSDFNRFGLAFWSLVDGHHSRNLAAGLERLRDTQTNARFDEEMRRYNLDAVRRQMEEGLP